VRIAEATEDGKPRIADRAELRVRSIASGQILVGLAEGHGMAVAESLVGTGLTELELATPTTMISADQELRLIGNIVRRLGDEPALGLRAGLRYHFTALGPVGFALVSSSTLGDAMDVALRYIDLTFALTRVVIERDEHECRVIVDAGETPPALRRFALERSVGVLFALARDVLGDVMLCRRLSFDLPPPPRGGTAVIRDLLGIAPRFGASRTELVLAAGDVSRPLGKGSPVALDLAESICRKSLADRTTQLGWSARVRSRIVARRSCAIDMDEIARDLAVSSRTLRRRLLAEGTTYSAICDEVLVSLAEGLLASRDLSIDEIADRLGYADATSFIAAFRRWTGKTPHAFRTSIPHR